LIVLVVYRGASNQPRIGRARGAVFAHVLEIQLFRHDLPSIFVSFAAVLHSTAAYLAASLRPVAILIAPLTLLFFHVAGWLEYRPLEQGEDAIITVRVDPSIDLAAARVAAEGAPAVVVSAGPFRSVPRHECSWRLKAAAPDGAARVDIRVGDQTARKGIAAARGLCRIEPRLLRGDNWRSCLNGAEAPLPEGGAIAAIEVEYPVRAYRMGGMDVGWLGAVFVLSLGVALLLKRPLHVEF
jgi:hypothetical protein